MKTNSQSNYEVKTDQFSGPLHVLLELVEKEELPISEVSLASVTQPYLEFIVSTPISTEELADFLTIATRLLYLKSKELLPELEEEEEASQLVDQLRIYQTFAEASQVVEAQFGVKPKMHVRKKAVLPKPVIPGFPTELSVADFSPVFERLLKRLRPFFRIAEASMERVRSVSERMQDLRSMIQARAQVAFRDLTKQASKMDVVVSFLALLELMKQRVVSTTQSAQFDDIHIHRV